MKDLTAKRSLRCAIYTRVSTKQGLEQDFNSLDPSVRLPRGYGLKRVVDLPMAWPDQWRALGLEASARAH
jgi:hypothetical protein